MADLSKIKLSGTTYNLKDAAVRADLSTLLGEHALAALHAAAWQDVDASVTAGAEGLPSTAAVKDYVDAQVGAIHNFDVRIYNANSEGQPAVAASADTMYILALVADAEAASGSYIEWITIRSGSEGAYTYAWEKIGSTQADLGDYVKRSTTVAGIALDHNITVGELEASSALDLKALSHKDTASGSTTLQTIDSIDMKAMTVAGNATVTHTSANATLTKGDYTPAGSVAVELNNAGVLSSVNTAGTLPTFAEGAFTANVPTALDLTKFNAGALPTKAADSFTAPTFAEGAFDAGSLPSLGSETKAQFAQEGVVASIDETDSEMLVLVAAGKADAVTAQGTFDAGSLPSKAADTFTAGSFSEGAFTQGSLPSLGEGFYTQGSAASKAADSFTQGAMPTFNTATVGVQSATFTGTEAENILVTGVAYDKADATAAFSETVTPEVDALNKSAKDIDITVS